MLKILGHLKKHTAAVILIVLLLCTQAWADLTLPDYIAAMIDVGIIQQGIEDSVPETLRTETFEQLQRIVSPAEAQRIAASYRDRGDGIAVLNPLTKTQRAELAGIFDVAGLSLWLMRQENISPDEMTQEAAAKALENRLQKDPQSILRTAAVQFVQAEYEAQGIDFASVRTAYLFRLGGRMALMAAIVCATAILAAELAGRTAAALGRDLRRELYHKVLTFSDQEFRRFSTASLITRSTNDVQQVQTAAVMMLRTIIFAPVLAAGGFYKILEDGPYLAWTLAVGVGAVLGVMLVLFLRVERKIPRMQKLTDQITLTAREMLTGMYSIRAFSAEKITEKHFDDANQDLTGVSLSVDRMLSLMIPVMTFILFGITVLILGTGAAGVSAGQVQLGVMLAFLIHATQIIASFLLIASAAVFLARAKASMERIEEVCGTVPAIRSPEIPVKPAAPEGTVEFRHVSFCYPDAREDVLHQISLRAERGTVTAVIGSTGSGISTALRLIPRFADVTDGQILVDGVDVRRMDLQELRSRIGYLPRRAVVTAGTVRSNLQMGNGDLPEARLTAALRAVRGPGSEGTEEELLDGKVLQGGANLSEGQRARIAVARALAGGHEIYVFDDCFSALDASAAAALMQSVRQFCRASTVLIASQRIGTIRNADQIIVLEEGRIVGAGTHQKLMAECAVYRQIAASQSTGEDPGTAAGKRAE